MPIKEILYKTITLPPHIVVRKAYKKAKDNWSSYCKKQRDKKKPTYLSDHAIPTGDLFYYLSSLSISSLKSNAPLTARLCRHYFNHCFDLLGSGWVQVKHGMECRGLESYCYTMSEKVEVDSQGKWLGKKINEANLKVSQSIWKLVDHGYQPIDWQLDFKSGYRWSERTPSTDISYGHIPGADVKVPWELSRMQHLPQLALAYLLALNGEQGFGESILYLREFRNQVLDFMATNPPRFGVNWSCTMDVAIRVANWLIAFDLFKSHGAVFDQDFEKAFVRSIFEHGQHIIHHLEWNPELRGNHYLSDLVGLLFVAAYLPCTPLVDAWLAFAIQELIQEVKLQFTEDGGNFEASTAYHCLSTELVTYATALILGLSPEKKHALRSYDHKLHQGHPSLQPSLLPHHQVSHLHSPFPAWYFVRLENMLNFCVHITKPNGEIPQIGDNDSGRLFKFSLKYEIMNVQEAKTRFKNLERYQVLNDGETYLWENPLVRTDLIAAWDSFFERPDITVFPGQHPLEKEMIRSLSRKTLLPSYVKEKGKCEAEKRHVGNHEAWDCWAQYFESFPSKKTSTLTFPCKTGKLLDHIRLYCYPDFGLYLYRSPTLYLAIRCGPIGQNGFGGHAHNDALSIELVVEGENRVMDLGSYLYTPSLQRRNQYRSVKAHFCPQVPNREPSPLDLGPFRLGNDPCAECLYFGEKGFIGRHRGFGFDVYRQISFYGSSIIVTDLSEGETLVPLSIVLKQNQSISYSPGYGILCLGSETA